MNLYEEANRHFKKILKEDVISREEMEKVVGNISKEEVASLIKKKILSPDAIQFLKSIDPQFMNKFVELIFNPEDNYYIPKIYQLITSNPTVDRYVLTIWEHNNVSKISFKGDQIDELKRTYVEIPNDDYYIEIQLKDEVGTKYPPITITEPYVPKHYNIKDLHLIYTVYKLDEDGDIGDYSKSFKNKEDAIKFAKTLKGFTAIYLETKEQLADNDIIEGRGSEDIYGVVWTNYEPYGDVMKRTTPKNQKLLLSYIENHLRDDNNYYYDYNEDAEDIAYYEFVEGDGANIIIPDVYVLSEGGDPDNVDDDIVDTYFYNELFDNVFKRKVNDLIRKYSK